MREKGQGQTGRSTTTEGSGGLAFESRRSELVEEGNWESESDGLKEKQSCKDDELL